MIVLRQRFGELRVKAQRIVSHPYLLRAARYGGILLTLASLARVLYQGWLAGDQYPWAALGNGLLLCVLIYGVSFNMQAGIWAMLMSRFSGEPYRWRDAEIYALSNLMRNTPGAIWYLIERVEAYKRDGIQARRTFMASAAEWGLLLAAAVFAYAVGWLAEVSQIGLMSYAAFLLGGWVVAQQFARQRRRRNTPNRNTPSKVSLWLANSDLLMTGLLAYVICYVLGALLIYVACYAINPAITLTIPLAIKLWALLGGISFLTSIIIPLSIGFRELTITFLFGPYVGSDVAVTVASLVRIVVVISDILYALLLWQVAKFAKRS